MINIQYLHILMHNCSHFSTKCGKRSYNTQSTTSWDQTFPSISICDCWLCVLKMSVISLPLRILCHTITDCSLWSKWA